jgi:TetR/AcrR family transcriptional regulator, regulator of cefoperazone and chloramphenicol sensitivity
MGTSTDSEITKMAIIEVAGYLFSEFGYSGVTIRDIVSKAHCNLNAVNYHFGSKRNLYRSVVLHACKIVSITLQEQKLLLSLPPKESLNELIKGILETYYQQRDSKWELALLFREVQNPGFLYTEVIDSYYKPQINFIAQIVGRCINQPHDSEQTMFKTFSLMSSLEMFGLYRHLIADVSPKQTTLLNEDRIIFQIEQIVFAGEQQE